MNIKVPKRIFLCGFMGAGKSTIGLKLAAHLDRPFLDLDEEIEEFTGQTIPEIFDKSGEDGFRTIEREVLLKISRGIEGVVALGGGSLQSNDLIRCLKQNGLLVFIEAPFSVILDRISGDENRPLLINECGKTKSRKQLEKELNPLYKERLAYYEQADIKLSSYSGQTSDKLVEQLLKKIKKYAVH